MRNAALLLLLCAAPAAAALNADVETRVQKLLDQMTLEEKLGQLQQLGGPVEGSPELIELAREGKLGSTLNVRGAKNVDAIQRAAVEGSRLKIPVLFGFDVIHGYRTIFPIPLALASSWDPSVVEKASRLAAREATLDGLRWTFSPMVDIARDPRWGRVAEGAGEDPFLGAAMARAYVRGYQGPDPSAPDSLAACAKHWVGYGAAEAGRDYSTTEISERTLREIYFPPFKAAVDAGALTFMSAFNDLDGVPASANAFTLTTVLRGEWGFTGFVVSDWDAVEQLIAHGIAADGAEAARRALTAGVDMEMDSRLYGAELPKLIAAGKVPQA
ncbi:MAG TPA: glycoside hydrolase family 3 N-terminal domain-containing protein, partial [Elusimicrobiota bacterium]|nr:glycoside hydrolase family 3 N-terminal domain-containing protein [Elusimicrobiota bacterium]